MLHLELLFFALNLAPSQLGIILFWRGNSEVYGNSYRYIGLATDIVMSL